MSSGESDAFTVSITSTLEPTNWYYPYSTNSYSYSYTTPIYFYQVTCPKCKNMLWAEPDRITTCQGKAGRKVCGARIKAVLETVDYEIPVVKPK
jgi:ribosomal protein S27E